MDGDDGVAADDAEGVAAGLGTVVAFATTSSSIFFSSGKIDPLCAASMYSCAASV